MSGSETLSTFESGPFSRVDRRWMRRALRLAERGFTPPNPRVGCILVKEDRVVGEGFHPYAGAPHAEVFALRAAGGKARGATAYVTLEPHSYFGRTPPCSRALLEAGVRRVVSCIMDPNPKVAGRGFEELKRGGVIVQVGLLEAEARRLNADFLHFHTTGLPLVTLKAAMTLDGKIATHTGSSQWITGDRARGYVHRLRAQAGAILCGVGTVLADDPLLTARIPVLPDFPEGLPRQPLRIVLDPSLRTPTRSRLVQTAREYPTLIAVSDDVSEEAAKNMQHYEVEIFRLPTDTEYNTESIKKPLDLTKLLAELGRREIISVMVEGGGQTHAAFLSRQLAHRVEWFIAPKLVGGQNAPTPLEGMGVPRMQNAVQINDVQHRRFGADLLIEGVVCYPDERREDQK